MGRDVFESGTDAAPDRRAAPSFPVSQPRRRTYSKMHLLSLRPGVAAARPSVDLQCAKPRSIYSQPPERRRNPASDKTDSINIMSSSSLERDNALSSRDLANMLSSNYTIRAGDVAGTEMRLSAEKNLSQSPHCSADACGDARLPRTLSSSLSEQLVRNTSGSLRFASKPSAFSMEHSKHSVNEYSRADGKQGSLENRRRLSSPNRSPRASPESSPSSSCPPGFGPPVAYRTVVKPSTRTGANGSRDNCLKSRICRGPNLEENFATRIAYHLANTNPAPTPLLDTAGREEASVEKPDLDTSGELEGKLSVVHESSGRLAVEEVEVNGSTTEDVAARKVPTLDYKITSEASFEDFSKRLALEAGIASSPGIIKDVIPGTEECDGRNRIDDSGKQLEPNCTTDTAAAPDQAAVDALSRWFGRIADESAPESGSKIPEVPHAAVELVTEVQLSASQVEKEELDSTMLSFFDSIRSQALGVELTNGTARKDEGDSSESAGVATPRNGGVGVNETSSQSVSTLYRPERPREVHATEVENFFQLFTEGKSACRKSPSASRKGSRAKRTDKSSFDTAEGVPHANQYDQSQRESDSGLERWFAALAAESQGH